MGHQTEFIQRMMDQGVLLFGEFTLKSGRQAPYFLNLGEVSGGTGLRALGASYAECILANGLAPEVLFGPAYKGIPLVTTTAVALAERGVEAAVAFNRKEAKGHGEGGTLVGADMTDKRVVVIDDVVVDGASKVESSELIRNVGGILEGIVIAIDRCEYADGDQTAAELLAKRLHTKVHSIASIEHVLALLKNTSDRSDRYEVVRSYADTHCKLS